MDKNESGGPSQITLILRLFCGGYLCYLAFGLRHVIFSSLLYLAGAVLFAAVGVWLLWSSLKKLVNGEYAGGPNCTECKEQKENEE